jgi:hypothetical protein
MPISPKLECLELRKTEFRTCMYSVGCILLAKEAEDAGRDADFEYAH